VNTDAYARSVSRWWAGWRVALRIARRDARRRWGTTVLAVAMIAVPIAAATAADILVTTNQMTVETKLTRTLGAADASFVLVSPDQPIVQDTMGTSWSPPGHLDDVFSGEYFAEAGAAVPPATQQAWVEQVVPDARVITQTIWETSVTSDQRRMTAKVWEYDLADPLAEGRVQMLHGDVPHGTDQVVVTPGVARALGLGVGGHLEVDGRALTVSGIAYLLTASTSAPAVIGQPGTLGLADKPASGLATTFFVDSPTPVGTHQVAAANARGMLVTSQQFAHHPSASAQAVTRAGSGGTTAVAAVLAVIGLFVLVQVILLAGPAFAVSARRSRRDLALASAAGAPPSQLRRTVLAGGVVVGLVAVAGGVAVGLLAGLALTRPWGSFHILGMVLGPVRVPWSHLAALVLVALVAATAAALFPARAAAGHHTRAALSSASRPSGRRRVPVLGAVLLGLGVVGALWLEYWQPNFRAGNPLPMFVTVATFASAEAGMIMLVPTLLRTVGRFSAHLPLLARLASRDAARSTGRTAPGVAAVMAVMAVAIAAAVGIDSWWVAGRNAYRPMAQPGQVSVAFGVPPDAALTADVRAAIASVAPVDHVYPVSVPAPLVVTDEGTTVSTERQSPDGPRQVPATWLVFTPVRTDAATCPITPALSSDATWTVDVSSSQAATVPTDVTGPTVADDQLTEAGIAIVGTASTGPRDLPQCTQFHAHNPVTATPSTPRPPVLLAGIVVDDGTGAPVLAPGASSQVAAALAAGQAVVFSPDDVSDGHALVQKSVVAQATAGLLGFGATPSDPYGPEISHFVDRSTIGRAATVGVENIDAEGQHVPPQLVGLARVRVPAVAVHDDDARALMILPPSLADRLGMTPVTGQVIATTTTMPTSAQEAQVTAAVFTAVGKDAFVNVERGYSNDIAGAFPVILWSSWILCLLIVVVAASLAVADARRDLSVSAAVGATPGLRRRLAAVTAAVLGLIGVVTGFVAGMIAVVALIGFRSHECAEGTSCSASAPLAEGGLNLSIPWAWVLLLAVGVPVLGSAAMALFTRSRIPLLPRAE